MSRLIDLCTFLHRPDLLQRLQHERRTRDDWEDFLFDARQIGILLPIPSLGIQVAEALVIASTLGRGLIFPESKTEATKQIKANAISVNQTKVTDPRATIETLFFERLILLESGKRSRVLLEIESDREE